VFEGESDLPPILDSLGRDWRIGDFSHKPYPAGGCDSTLWGVL
jgi:hypothetical protein